MKIFDAVFGSLAMVVVGLCFIVCITAAYRRANSTESRSERPRPAAVVESVKLRRDAVVEYERLDDVGYIFTARHRGHLYVGAAGRGGAAFFRHSPECDCRSAEAAE